MSSPYMTTAELADYLRFTVTSKAPLVSAWKWINRRQLKVYPVGRNVRVLRAAVDAVLSEEAAQRAGRRRERLTARFNVQAGCKQLIERKH
jgi:hypothetical protein